MTRKVSHRNLSEAGLALGSFLAARCTWFPFGVFLHQRCVLGVFVFQTFVFLDLSPISVDLAFCKESHVVPFSDEATRPVHEFKALHLRYACVYTLSPYIYTYSIYVCVILYTHI